MKFQTICSLFVVALIIQYGGHVPRTKMCLQVILNCSICLNVMCFVSSQVQFTMA